MPSLCEGWTVRDVLGHLVMSLETGFGQFLVEVVRDRGRVARTSQRLARQVAARPVPELVGILRQRRDAEVSAPGVGPMGPMADTCIHLRDVAIPLGLSTTAPLEDWRRVLAFLVTPRARAGGFVPRGRLRGLRFTATDQEWSGGDGTDEVTGSSEALALAMTGRAIGLDQLSGLGVAVLRARVQAASHR